VTARRSTWAWRRAPAACNADCSESTSTPATTSPGPAFRRNVAEHLGVATVAQAKQRPSVMTDEQVDAVNAWVAGCQVAWMETSSGKQAGQLEKELKSERRPPLTKR